MAWARFPQAPVRRRYTDRLVREVRAPFAATVVAALTVAVTLTVTVAVAVAAESANTRPSFHLELDRLLAQPGTRALAVVRAEDRDLDDPQFRAWRELHRRLRSLGFAVVVVQTPRPDGACAGVLLTTDPDLDADFPDLVVCDAFGRVSRSLGWALSVEHGLTERRGPRALVWAWPGGLVFDGDDPSQLLARLEEVLTRTFDLELVFGPGLAGHPRARATLTQAIAEEGRFATAAIRDEPLHSRAPSAETWQRRPSADGPPAGADAERHDPNGCALAAVEASPWTMVATLAPRQAGHTTFPVADRALGVADRDLRASGTQAGQHPSPRSTVSLELTTREGCLLGRSDVPWSGVDPSRAVAAAWRSLMAHVVRPELPRPALVRDRTRADSRRSGPALVRDAFVPEAGPQRPARLRKSTVEEAGEPTRGGLWESSSSFALLDALETHRQIRSNGRDDRSLRRSSPLQEGRQAHILRHARALVGAPYRSPASPPATFDDDSVVPHLYRVLFGLKLPRSADALWRQGVELAFQTSRSDSLVPGDVVFHLSEARRPRWTGLYLGDGLVLGARLARGVQVLHLRDLGPLEQVAARRYLQPRLWADSSTDMAADAPSFDVPRGPIL